MLDIIDRALQYLIEMFFFALQDSIFASEIGELLDSGAQNIQDAKFTWKIC